MKSKELKELIRKSLDHVGLYQRDAARIYVAVVELHGQMLMWKKRALDAGWQEPTDPAKNE